MSQLKLEAEIENLGRILYIEAPFDKALEIITSNGNEFISARNLAYARTQEDSQHSLSRYGSYIKEGDIYIPNKSPQILLIRNSPLLQLELAKEAVKAHQSGKEYSIAEKLAKEYSEKASEDQNSEVFPLTNLEAIATNKFDADKRTLWLFQDQAEKYGKFLYDNNIKEMPLYFNDKSYINEQVSPFANQLWLHDLGNWSPLHGYGRGLDYSVRVRGVSSTGEASAQKISEEKGIIESYTPKQISTALKELKISGLESQIINKLKEKY